jgi:hypothetical protein
MAKTLRFFLPLASYADAESAAFGGPADPGIICKLFGSLHAHGLYSVKEWPIPDRTAWESTHATLMPKRLFSLPRRAFTCLDT